LRPLFLALGFVLLSVVSPSPAWAQAREGFSLDRFRPAPTTEDGLALVWPRTLGHLRPGASLTLDYAHQPLVLGPRDEDAEGAIVKHRLVGHLNGALGLGDRFELFVHAPVTFVQKGDDPSLGGLSFPDPRSASFGDLTLGGSLRVLGDDLDATQVGLTLGLTAPSGNDDALSGNGGLGGEGLLSFAHHTQSVTVSLNAGGRYRPEVDYGNVRLGSEVLLGAGVAGRIGESLSVLAELTGSTSLRARTFKSDGTPLEGLIGARWTTPLGLVLTPAAGVGITQAVGVPDVRMLLSVGWPPPRPPLAPPDRDHDGIVDDQDRCPTIPEDKDDFEDADGCPDPDNDQDGVADVRDECPLDPEDIDGFADGDGCPEPDNDKDGIADARDRCPVHAEDKDGFQDEDGCPEADNDQDGLPDKIDSCPIEAEDHDGFEDDDGCPDLDNDKDGILDADDACPTAPGPAETRGCPRAVRLEAGQIKILQRIEFETKRAELRPSAEPILDEVRLVLQVNPQIRKVRIEGHTDDRGKDAFNLDLSQRRAETVMKWLIDGGIDAERLTAEGKGETSPLVPNDSPENLQTNRRVEFHIVDPAPAAGDANPLEPGAPLPPTEATPADTAPAQPAPAQPAPEKPAPADPLEGLL
jgi:outer membrane protein OmpA-like peptidoglycan-associated protein